MVKMDTFLEERKVVKETGAILNFFRLYHLASVTQKHYLFQKEYFAFLGGTELLERLIVDCQEENIDIFSRTFVDFANQLNENLNMMKQITFSKGNMENQLIQMIQNFQKSCTIYLSNSSAYSKLLENCSFLKEELKELEKYQPQQKKLKKDN